MTLRVRTLAVVCLTTFTLAAAAQFLVKSSVTHGLLAGERGEAAGELAGNKKVIAASLEEFRSRWLDWSEWDDTCDFIRRPSAAYIKSNLVPNTFLTSHVDLLAYLDTKARVVWSGVLRRSDRRVVRPSADYSPVLGARLDAIQYALQGHPECGLLRTPGGVMVLAALPVRRSDGTGPVHGVFVAGRLVDELETARLARLCQAVGLTLTPISDQTVGPQEMAAVALSDHQLRVTGYLRDMGQQPILALSWIRTRDSFQHGLAWHRRLVWALVLSSMVFLLVITVFLERTVLSRLASLTGQLQSVRANPERMHRVRLPGGDELAELCGTINEMLCSLEFTALHDDLTGLPNRLLFTERLTHGLVRSSRTPDRSIAVLYIDLDRFKAINDTLGHPIGDRLLQLVARRILAAVRAADTVARLGGDEFAVLLEDLPNEELALEITRRISQEVEKPFEIDEHQLYVSASVGVAFSGFGGKDPEEMLRNADIALYSAKSSGKARYAVFDAIMHGRLVEQLELGTEIRSAIERRQIRVHYQPIVEVDSCRLVGFEALARWDHPRLGWIAPERFIPVAEEMGLAGEIDILVMEEALRQLKEWDELIPKCAPIWMSVNISGKHLTHNSLISNVHRIVVEQQVDADRLMLEITETTAVEHLRVAVRTINRLREMGVRIALDDFGTGQSSLSYLHRFSVDMIKIDRSFISTRNTGPDKWGMIRSIIALARSRGMQVVAEGTERIAQWKHLMAMDCDYSQGFLFSRPVPAAEAARLVLLGRVDPDGARVLPRGRGGDGAGPLYAEHGEAVELPRRIAADASR